MTVFDNVAFAMRVIGTKEKEIRKRVPYVLSLVGLASKARHLPTQLSGGEQQRVALARALVNNAGLIIADEPTGNIDHEMSYEIVDLLNHINASGTTVVMVTHEHNLVRHFHHRVITIDNGSVVSDSEDTNALPADYEQIERRYPAEKPAEASVPEAEKPVHKSAFYIEPNSDKELEEFMQTYGAVSDDAAEDTIDYSVYLNTEENGGEAK